jgi:glutamyl/glutaminyl-tRNA synthetase
MAIRIAVTGKTATPPLFDTLVALGYDRTLERLDRAREALKKGVS